MKLLTLGIKNFRVIKSAQLSFPDKVIGIVGPNGAGKTSIIEAISYALYGNQVTRSGKDEIKSSFASPDEDCEITLEFLIKDEKYKIIRRLVGKTERAEVELYRKDCSESIGVIETKTYLSQLLGLDWRGFLSSFLARQSELNALSDLQPSKRQDHIAGMLGIEKLDKAIKKTKDDIRLNREKVIFLEKDISDKEAIETRITELTGSIQKIKTVLKSKEDNFSGITTSHQELTKKYQNMSANRDKFMSLRASQSSEKKTLEELFIQKNILISERDELEKLKEKASSLENELKEYPDIKEKLKQLVELKNQSLLKKQFIDQKKSITEEINSAESQLSQIEIELKKLSDKRELFSDDIKDKLNTEKNKLETARSDYTKTKTELLSIQKEKEKLSVQLKSISELGPESVCDHCLRPLGDDYNEIQNHFNIELAQFQKGIELKEKTLVETKKEGEAFRLSVDKLDKDIKEIYQIDINISSNRKELDGLSNRIEKSRIKLSETDAEIAKHKDVSFDLELYERLLKKEIYLDEREKEFERLSGKLTRQSIVQQQIADISHKISTVEKNIEQTGKDLEDTDFDEKSFEELTAKFQISQNNLDTTKGELIAVQKEWELTQKELELKLEQLAGYEKKSAELEKIKSSHYYGEKLSNLFGEYRKDIIASIRPNLADISSRLFNEMTDNKYSLVELDEKYNLRVMDGGLFYGVDRFSGGEKDLANLCLRLAISVTLTESAGLDRSFVILDEVFGSQDNERKDLILNALGKMKNRFPQIILITHIEDIKDGVEEIIDVKPTGFGWSEVIVNESV